ncbi:MAG: hypothetical protein HY286_14515 [Planctomycetes bacterium]|nr:hypothetical protein [Planctomycetota bacterium]
MIQEAVADNASHGPPAARPRMKFANQAAISLIAQAATQVLVIITMLIMPRIIPPDVKGPAELVTNLLATFLIVFSNMGFATAILYHPDRGNIPVERITSSLLTLGICMSASVAIVCSLFLPAYFSEQHKSIIEPWHVALVLATCPLQLATSYLNATQVAAGRIIGFNFIQFLPTGIYVSTFFTLYFAVGPEKFRTNPQWFVTGMVFAHVVKWTVSSTVTVFLLRNIVRLRPSLDFEILKKALRFGARPYFRDVFQCCTFYATPYFLNWQQFSEEDLGYYTLAVSAMTAVWQLPEALHMILANRMATQSSNDRKWFTPIVCRNVVFATFCGALAIGVMAEIFVTFLWPRYVKAVPTIRIMLTSSVLFTFFKVLQTDLMARGEINLVPILSGAAFFLLAIFNFFAIMVFGWRDISVSAACSSLAMGIVGIFTVVYYSRISGNPLLKVILIQKEDLQLWREFAGRIFAKKVA